MAGNDILSRIQILLDANTANFEQNLQNAQRTSVSTFDKIKSSAKVMGTAVAAGAASAVGALAAMAWETANQAAELEKFAFRANTTTQDFQKMAVGAQAYGIEQEALSDMMKDFNEKLGELTTIGAGGGVDFFEKIAVKTEGSAAAAEKLILKMQKLSGPEALQLYVDKLEEAGVTQQQMSFYLESMASDMTDLYPLLANGGEGMKYYADMAERFGVIMADETLESAALLKDQMYSLDLQMKGAKNQLVQAVIPAFVDIAGAFFSSSDQGLQFTEVSNGIAKGLKVLASIAIGAVTAIQLVGKALGGMAAIGGAIWNETDWYEMNPIGLVKAAYEARAEISALTTEMKADMHSTVMGAADRMDKMWSGAAAEEAKKLRGFRELELANKGVNKGLGELAEKQDKAEKSAKKAAKANSELNNVLRDQERALEQAKRLVYEYGDELLRIEEDLKKDLEEIQGATLKAEAKDRYSALAKAQAASRKQLYLAELENELYEHRKTEEEKLADELRINKLRLDAQRGLNKNEIDLRKQALDDKYRLELSQIDKEKRSRVNTAMAAWGGTYSDMTGQGEDHALSQQRFSRIDESQELFDAQMALANTAAEREAIWQAHHERMIAIESAYQQGSYGLQLGYGEQVTGALSNMLGTMLGESSSTYQALFYAQRSFALAQAGMNVWKAASDAYANEPGTVWQKMGAAALATIESGTFVSMIQAATPVGMAHNGIDNIPKEGTWLLDKGERVVDSRTNADLKNYLANGGGSGGDVNITVHVTDSGVTTQSNQSDQKQLGQMIGNAVRTVIRQEQRQGGLLAR